MNGIVVVDKPKGITSFDVVARVRRALHEKRVGHTGTLDPMATGVLPVCVGEATKLVQFLQAGEKEYLAEARFGISTDTLDATGQVTNERDASAITEAAVRAAAEKFVGDIDQIPPMHSAIRKDGKRLYELAREGIEIERDARPVRIYGITLESFENQIARLRVHCGKGTYIRSLASDIGETLGVGAHLISLQRTRVGRFTIADAVSIEKIAEAPVIGLDQAVSDLPTISLSAEQARDVRDGKISVINTLESPAEGLIRLLRPEGTLLAVATSAQGKLTLERVFVDNSP